LLDSIDSGNEADSESEEDVPATYILEPIVVYLDNPDCNNHAENESEWVLNENVIFNYFLCFEDVFKSVDISSLHIPLPILEVVCMHIEDNEGSVFVVSPSNRDRDRLPIVFGRGQTWTTTSKESEDDLEPHNSFITHGQHTA